MTRRVAGALLGTVVLLAAALIYIGSGDSEEPASGGGPHLEEREVASVDDVDLPLAPLYFPGAAAVLLVEERPLGPWSTPEDGARVVAEAILAGPSDETLSPPLPQGTMLGVTHLTAGAVLYLDLVSTQHTRPPVTGSQEELLSVYSLVNSILLNVPEIEAVVLLWNGRQLPTFAGHLDTSLPLRADRDLVRRRR